MLGSTLAITLPCSGTRKAIRQATACVEFSDNVIPLPKSKNSTRCRSGESQLAATKRWYVCACIGLFHQPDRVVHLFDMPGVGIASFLVAT